VTDARAEEAARSVLATFGGRALGVPRTRLATVARPGRPRGEWHYWWQAHLIDCLVDARLRGSALVDDRLIRSHIRGVWLRNGLRFRNGYFDDMAWLALATQRFGRLGGADVASRRLRPVLESALRHDWGGGALWSTQRDFINTAATGPIALFLARAGERDVPRRMLGWLRANLADADGLMRDGLRVVEGRLVPVSDVFTYNQGPVLGLMLELGGDELPAAEAHVRAVARRLTRPGTRVLRTHGAGDGGLFSGILTRYLALAAADPRLDRQARILAGEVVTATADDLWDRRAVRGWRGRPVVVFPQDTHADAVGETAELSTQLQAWMALEAAAVTVAALR